MKFFYIIVSLLCLVGINASMLLKDASYHTSFRASGAKMVFVEGKLKMQKGCSTYPLKVKGLQEGLDISAFFKSGGYLWIDRSVDKYIAEAKFRILGGMPARTSGWFSTDSEGDFTIIKGPVLLNRKGKEIRGEIPSSAAEYAGMFLAFRFVIRCDTCDERFVEDFSSLSSSLQKYAKSFYTPSVTREVMRAYSISVDEYFIVLGLRSYSDLLGRLKASPNGIKGKIEDGDWLCPICKNQ